MMKQMEKTCKQSGGRWMGGLCVYYGGRQLPISDKEDYSFNFSEMLDGIEHQGLMSALKAYDTDKNGIISGEENTAMIDKATAVFYITDADRNGQLNPQEFQRFVHKMTHLQVEKVFTEQEQQQMFSDLDIDGNGALTQDEMDEPTVVEDIVMVLAASKRG